MGSRYGNEHSSNKAKNHSNLNANHFGSIYKNNEQSSTKEKNHGHLNANDLGRNYKEKREEKVVFSPKGIDVFQAGSSSGLGEKKKRSNKEELVF